MKKRFLQAWVIIGPLWFIAVLALWFHLDNKSETILTELAFNAVVVTLILGAAWIVGDRLKFIIGENSEGLEGFLIALGLGLGADILFLFAIGMVGLLYQPVIMAMIGIPFIFSVKRISNFLQTKPWNRELGELRLSGIEWIVALSFFMVGIFLFLNAVKPETFFDALYYHLAFPSLYLIRHRIDLFPHAVHSALPSNIDLLYAMPLSFAGPGAVRLLHIAFYAGSLLWIYSLGKRLFGREAGIVGSMLWGTIPGVHWIAGLGGVDMGVAFFDLGAISLLLKWIFEEEDRSILTVSAILLGLAVGSKYTALMVGVICAAGVLIGTCRKVKTGMDFRKAMNSVLLYGAVSLAVASPWYVRNWILTGDPLYPAFSRDGSAGQHARDNIRKDSQSLYPLKQTFTKLPADVWRRPADFGAVTRLGLGVWVFFPALFWAFWQRGRVAWLGVAVLGLYLMWSRSILILRYLYPALAFASVFGGGMLASETAKKRILGIGVRVFLVTVLLFDLKTTVSFYESSPIGAIKYFIAQSSPTEALRKYVPHTLPANWTRDNLPVAGTKLLMVGETQGYYFQRDYMPVSAFDRHPVEDWVKQVHNSEELRMLIKEKGFTHLLLCRHEWDVMNRAYGYLTLDQSGRDIFEGLISSLQSVYSDRYYQIYAF